MKASLDWKQLGANRSAKIVIIVALCILGTMETVFWCKVVYRKFYGVEGLEEGVEGSDAEK